MSWLRTLISLTIGLVLLVGTIMWSTGRLHLPGPFAALRQVPEEAVAGPGSAFYASVSEDLGREFRQALVDRIWQERLITITVHVALCDSRLSRVSNPLHGNGNDFRRNLYWGARYGVERYYQNLEEWKPLYSGPAGSSNYILRRVVFRREVKPGVAWQQRGVTEPFEICLLAIAWSGPSAGNAVQAAVMDAAGMQQARVITVGTRRLAFGSASALVGYVGYNPAKENPGVLANFAEQLPQSPPRGVFMITPYSLETIGPTLQKLGVHPILLTTDTLIPEAYVLQGVTEALARGEIERGFSQRAAEYYAEAQKRSLRQVRPLFLP